ncbi:MAG: alpha/beta hydrolase [Mesorhizobium sp.]|jgi:lysophospholipase
MADLDAPSLAEPVSELLHETPGNPLPEGARAGLLRTHDGKKLRYARFDATERPLKGTVVLLPGRNESIEKYFETIADLARRGLAVATLDWRGQGLSDRLLRNRERGHVDRFDSYVRDLEQLFDEVVLPDCRGPFFILAHSTGALTALLAAPAMANRVRRMVLVAPLLALAGVPMSMKGVHRLASSLYWTGFGRLYLGGGRRSRAAGAFEGNVLTSDEQRYRRNQEIVRLHPELALGGPTAGWIRAMCLAVEAVERPEFAARIQIPTLLVAAGADRVVSTQAIERYARRLRSGRVLTIDGARHEILQERDRYREQLLGAFDAFVPGTGSES